MKRFFYKIIYVVILICVVICFGNLKFGVNANEENNSYSLIGKLNCDDEINFSTIRLNVYSFDVQNKDLISESELLTSIYADNLGKISINQNISSCYVEVDLLSLPFGYGIISDTFVYTENNMIMIDIIKIDKIVINNMETNDFEFYSDNDTELLAIYSNEQLNNIDNIIYNEVEMMEITSSEISDLELLLNTNTDTDFISTYALDNNLSSSIMVNNIKFQFNVSVGDYGSSFESIYNSIKQYAVAAYLSFEQLFNVTPYSEIVNNQKIIQIYLSSGAANDSYVNFVNSILEIGYCFLLDGSLSTQFINYLISHEMGHYFLYFMTKMNNNSSINSTVINEGIAEFISIYNVLILENVSMENIDPLIINRLLNFFATFFKCDNNTNRPKDGYGCGINYGYYYFSVNKTHLVTTQNPLDYKNEYSYFAFFLFLYEYYDYYVFDVIKFMLEYYVEKRLSLSFSDDFLIEMFEYLESNNGQLENQSLNGLNYDIKALIEEFNLFTSFPSKYVNSLPQELLNMMDSIVFEETNPIYTGGLSADEASVYDSRIYYDKSFSYRSRKFVAKSQNDDDFENENYLKMYLRYYSDMAIQLVYRNQNNEVTSVNQYYYYDTNSIEQYNSKNLTIYIPESTECIIYVYYLDSNTTCNESKVRFANLTAPQDEINFNNCINSYSYNLNNGTVFNRVNFINGQYKINLIGNASFKYKLYDENLNLISNLISIESETEDNIIETNYITLSGTYYFSIQSITSSNNIVQFNVIKNTFATNYSINMSSIFNGSQYTINTTIELKPINYGLYNVFCNSINEDYEISILIYEDGNLTKKYGKNFANPLARYYDNTANIFFKNNKIYTVEIIITSSINFYDNVSFGIYQYNDVEIGTNSYQIFELNASEKYGTGMVFKSLNNLDYIVSIGYIQNVANNIDVNVYICKVSWNGGVLVSQLVLKNSNKSNFINVTLNAGEKLFLCIDTIIENDFVLEIMLN